MYRLEQWEMYTEIIAQNKMKDLLGIIINSYRKNETEIVNELLKSVKVLLKKYETAQQIGNKGKLKVIQFSFLHLSVLKGDFEIYVEAFDRELYFNRYEVNEIWRASIIYDYYEEYVAFLIKKCEQNVKDFSYKEKQKLCKKAAFDFHVMTMRIVAEHVQKVVELDEFQKLDVETQGIISFGEYMNESQPICMWNLGMD